MGQLAVAGLAAAFILGCWRLFRYRRAAYTREVPFAPRQNFRYQFDATTTTLTAKVSDASCTLPPAAFSFDTAFLALDVSASAWGSLREPRLLLDAGGIQHAVSFERGASGIRYVDLSPFVRTGQPIRLSGQDLTWRSGETELRVWRQPLTGNETVLVVAPHPDDAEIAAYGMYASHRSHIVTISAGDRLSWRLSDVDADVSRHPRIAAKLRVWNSLTIPLLGGVPLAHSYQLAYPDGRLAEMHRAPDVAITTQYDFGALRRLNESPLADRDCSWRSLVGDLHGVLTAVQPDVVVVPFPVYDDHPDHGYSAVALCEAMRGLAVPPKVILQYINHAVMTPHWPFGPSGSLAALPPCVDGQMPIGAMWSRALTKEEQRDKLLAIEAMHDLRDGPRLGQRPWREIIRDLIAEIGAKIRGMERQPNNYFRRAVRGSELFFVTTPEQFDANASRFLREQGGRGPA